VSEFTDLFREQALSAWRAARGWPLKYATQVEKLGRWVSERGPKNNLLGYTGFFSAILLPIIGSFISVLLVLVAELVIVGYALLTSALWGLGAAIEIGPRTVRRAIRQARDVR
jgi:hypothetical protein